MNSSDVQLFQALPEPPPFSANIDRRRFLMRSTAIGAAAAMTGVAWSPQARAQQAEKEASTPPRLGATLSPDLNVVKSSKGTGNDAGG